MCACATSVNYWKILGFPCIQITKLSSVGGKFNSDNVYVYVHVYVYMDVYVYVYVYLKIVNYHSINMV